jgi:hypothetical protein
MKRLFALTVGAALLGVPTLGATTSAVASPRTVTAPAAVAGHYNEFFDYGGGGTYSEEQLILLGNHTGTGQFGDVLTWSQKGKKITLHFSNTLHPGLTARFLGTVTAKGFNSKKKPGTMSNSAGETGVWYAIKTG